MFVLDWRKHSTGPNRPCRLCGKPTILRDENGKAAHKVCAERELEQKARGAR